MIFILILVAIFVFVSVYFYFRSEKLQQDLRTTRRDFALSKKEGKALSDKIALVINRYEEFAKFRLTSFQEGDFKNNPEVSKQIEFITPLINNYGAIFRACLSSKEQLKPMCQKCFDGLNPNSYQGFVTYLNGKESHIRKMWSSNNLVGFISLVEALLTDISTTIEQLEKQKALD